VNIPQGVDGTRVTVTPLPERIGNQRDEAYIENDGKKGPDLLETFHQHKRGRAGKFETSSAQTWEQRKSIF